LVPSFLVTLSQFACLIITFFRLALNGCGPCNVHSSVYVYMREEYISRYKAGGNLLNLCDWKKVEKKFVVCPGTKSL
jgi:hypothetical protein